MPSLVRAAGMAVVVGTGTSVKSRAKPSTSASPTQMRLLVVPPGVGLITPCDLGRLIIECRHSAAGQANTAAAGGLGSLSASVRASPSRIGIQDKTWIAALQSPTA